MSETIVLPKSGVTLRRTAAGKYVHDREGVWLSIEPSLSVDNECVAWRGRIGSGRVSIKDGIAWLDRKAIELVESLLPADARERVARAIYHVDTGRCDTCIDGDPDRDTFYELADAALTALAGEGEGTR